VSAVAGIDASTVALTMAFTVVDCYHTGDTRGWGWRELSSDVFVALGGQVSDQVDSGPPLDRCKPRTCMAALARLGCHAFPTVTGFLLVIAGTSVITSTRVDTMLLAIVDDVYTYGARSWPWAKEWPRQRANMGV
jgi:hypothetical protein